MPVKGNTREPQARISGALGSGIGDQAQAAQTVSARGFAVGAADRRESGMGLDFAQDAVGEGRAIRETREEPRAICCDNGPELTSQHFLAWTLERQIELLHVEPAKP